MLFLQFNTEFTMKPCSNFARYWNLSLHKSEILLCLLYSNIVENMIQTSLWYLKTCSDYRTTFKRVYCTHGFIMTRFFFFSGVEINLGYVLKHSTIHIPLFVALIRHNCSFVHNCFFCLFVWVNANITFNITRQNTDCLKKIYTHNQMKSSVKGHLKFSLPM